MKIIMIDAFKPAYLKYAPYLSSLIKKNQWGELEMPMGHWGGEKVFFRGGKQDRIALFRKSDNSSLKWVRHFSWLDRFGRVGRFVIDSMINLVRLIRGQELFRTGNIPLNRLWKFDFCVHRPLYKIEGLDKTYMGDLDGVGHEYGTKGKEIIEAIKSVDKKISEMEFDVIFSDHGMVDVTEHISVPWTGDCFIDSDMARYWGNLEEIEKIKKKLDMKKGRIVEFDDKSYGDLIYMVKEGIVITPNFWQGNKKYKGMHGYDGKSRDMHGIYILNKKGKRRDLKVGELHKIVFGDKNEI